MLALLGAMPTWAKDGAQLFGQSCGLCHQPSGLGAPGLAPPLVEKALWESLGTKAVSYITGVMLTGLSGSLKAGDSVYSGLVMPPQDRMTDDELAAIGSYVLGTLNDSQARVFAIDVARVRSNPPTHADLRAMRPKIP